MKKILICSILTLFMCNYVLSADNSFTQVTKIENIGKGKYPPQIDSFENFFNSLNCLKRSSTEQIGLLSCEGSNKGAYYVFLDNQKFNKLCSKRLEGKVNKFTSNNGWINYVVCDNQNDADKITTIEVHIANLNRKVYMASTNVIFSANEPLLLYFMNYVIKNKDENLKLNY